MAYVAGIDLGTRMTKAVITNAHGELLARASLETGARLEKAAERVFDQALREAGLRREEIAYVAATGYGRYQVAFRQVQITDVTCHATGALYLFPRTRSVLDVGAMNSRAMRIAESGRVIAFRMNDKCASGAGRFLERVARALELELSQIGTISLRSEDPQPISSICAVLAESEVINHVTAGKKVEDILRGAHNSISERIVALLRQVGSEPEVSLTGGVTKNLGMVRALEERLQLRVNVSPQAEFAGAIGAALLGLRRLNSRGASPNDSVA